MTDNLSAILYEKNDLRLEQRPIPAPGQLLIRINTVGICGSDVHYLKHMGIGSFIVRAPMVLGHETSGTVAEIGEGVTGFQKGDRVAMEPGIPCRRCSHCKKGAYNLCPEIQFFATPPVHGTLTRYVAHDADFCFKLPDHVTFEEGALLEPLSVAVYTCRRGGVTVGQNVLVLGAGGWCLTGLLFLDILTVKVLVTDIDQGRLDLAKKLGANHVLNVRGKTVEAVKAEILAAFGELPDVSLECTGAASSVETGIMATRSGGVLVLVGMGATRVEIPLIEAACREVDIRGIFRYANCYKTALELVASKKLDLSGLTRAHYKLEESVEAFARFDKQDVVKIFIHCD